MLAAGIVPSAVAARIPVAHDDRGRIAVDAAMRSRSHPEVWALGDCAAIPGPDGRPYPALAQHAIREARQLAQNLVADARRARPAPFIFRSLGTMAALGHTQAVAQVLGVRLTGLSGVVAAADATTCCRCRAGTGGSASSSTGRWRSSSGPTSRRSTSRTGDASSRRFGVCEGIRRRALRSPHLPRPSSPRGRGGRKTFLFLALFPSLPLGERGQGSEGFGGHAAEKFTDSRGEER